MAIRADSYSSTAEVKAFTRHLLDGQTGFNSTTRPNSTELEKFIDRASGVLNVAIAKGGFNPSSVYNNSTAKLSCDDWVTNYAVRYVELTQRGTGYNEDENSRASSFRMDKSASDFVKTNSLGFIRLGISQNYRMSEGLVFTGMSKQSLRTDRSDTTKEQPVFERHQFNNPQINSTGVV